MPIRGPQSGQGRGTVFDRAAASYGRIGGQFFEQAGQALVQLALPQPGEDLLDVGCGRGASLLPAAAAVTPRGRAVGIDKSSAMVSQANRALAARGLTHAFAVVADADALPTRTGTFDVLLAGLVLQFLPEPQRTLRRLTHMLRPGGRIAICTPAAAPDDLDVVDRTADAALIEFMSGSAQERAPMPGIDSSAIVAAMHQLEYVKIQVLNMFFPISVPVSKFWDWRMSHGRRTQLERIPEKDRERAREKLVESVRAVSVAGQVHLPMPVCMIAAYRT
ncbi:MAG TPA: methyltransferase domain-containing protein [Streptomyces sp.]|uniref:class I SAM-dependent methyltransferase n=1 Tax=Streptomyces sp. TaxID=1931 RepID=UPI002C2ED971|nr:methyltransferase domain-containing protein [Streptomyces sp.]HWU11122.1 methyltransferase domain-containing protein [Streptomyces sp.]